MKVSIFSGDPSSLIRIDVEPIMVGGRQKATHRGTWYRAKLGDEVIVPQAIEPLFPALRVLHKRGYSGGVGMWVAGQFRMACSVDPMHKYSIMENSKSFGLVKYDEFEPFAEERDTEDEDD